MTDWTELPEDLPVPEDDGGADHLLGLELPIINLPATDGRIVDLSNLSGRAVVYCYPRMGEPGQPMPVGWNEIPGARGCTPQACSFRDHFEELVECGAHHVFGLSTQNASYQRDAAERLHLPFPLLSDHTLEFTRSLNLPTFTAKGKVLLRRLTLIIEDGVIGHVFYPVFPPHTHAEEVVQFLKTHVPR